MTDSHGPWGPERPQEPPKRRLRVRKGALLWLALLAVAGAAIILLSTLVPGQAEGQGGFEVFRLLGLAALVSSGLLSLRQVNLGKAARGAALWGAILIVLVLGYAYRNDVGDAALRLRSALFPAFAVTSTPHTLIIGRSEGGGFYVMGQVNGTPVLFLIDTGASEIVLSPADAARAHVSTAGLAFSRPSETANGVGYGARTTVDRLTVGSIRLADVPVEINQAPMNISLLGMPFLQRLDSFEVRGDQLILRGKP